MAEIDGESPTRRLERYLAAFRAGRDNNRLANARLGPHVWQCDVCHRARFPTFQEASAHEETCDGTFDPESVPMVNWDKRELRRWHQRKCNEGDGWSHGFDMSYDNDGKITGYLRLRQIPSHEVLQLFGLENWRRASDFMRKSTSLKKVELDASGYLNAAVFGGDWKQSPLEWLDLGGNEMGVETIRTLLPMLKSLSKLKYLVLSRNHLGNEGARVLSEDLSQIRVETLHLRYNNIGDAGVMSLLAGGNASHILHLSLSGNEIGRVGFGAISSFLGRAATRLTSLFIDCPNGETAKRLIDSIAEGSVLETLSLWDSGPGATRLHDRDRQLIVQSLKNKVCNTSSFDSLCRSNHRLSWLGGGDVTWDILNLDPVLKCLFDINARARRGAPIAKIIRFKLHMCYFQREFDVQPFADINVRLLPRFLELVTRSEVVVGKKERDLGSGIYYEVYTGPIIRLANIYRIVRNCHIPELYTFLSPEVDVESLKSENAALKAEILLLKAKVDQTNDCDVDGSSKSPKKRSKASES